MEFVRELTFTAFAAVILYWVLAMVISSAVAISNSTNRNNTSVSSSVDEDSVAKDKILNSGLRVSSSKGAKKVKFVDDIVIKSTVDRYEGLSESVVLLSSEDGVESMGDSIVEGESLNVEISENDRLKEDSLAKISAEEQGSNTRKKMHDVNADNDEGLEITEMVIEEKCYGDNLDDENEENPLDVDALKSVIVEEHHLENDEIIANHNNNESELMITEQNDDRMSDHKERIELAAASKEKNDKKSDHHEEENEFAAAAPEEIKGLNNTSGGDNDDDNVEDDWEGIERTELEKVFAQAVNYVEYGMKKKVKDDDDWLAKLSSDEQMQLHGLHKLAVEGPCHDPQPMALKVSARAKWNAWQRLGSMSPEAAMEQYIKILSDNNPQWIHNHSAGDE